MEIRSLFVAFIYIVHSINAQCSSPWKSYKDSCYLFTAVSTVSPGHTWEDSRFICQRYGGDLLKLDNDNETKYINSQFDDLKIKYNHYWIGLNDIKKEGDWRWADQAPLNVTTQWRVSRGEPNNWQGNEDCIETTYDGQWNDNECSRMFGYICERSKDAVIPVTPTLPPFPTATDKPTTCEAGWIPWGTSCYGIIRGLAKNFQDAQADCLRRFGDLVVINDQAENDFISNEISRSVGGLWIGLSDTYKEGTFYWVDKSELNFTSWRAGEPSNDYGNEDCVEIYGRWGPGQWNDNHCTALRDYICEKPGGVHNCPRDWVSYKNYCYQINAHPGQKVTWEDARKNCLDFNKAWRKSVNVAQADLVSITNLEEQKMLQKEFSKVNIKNDNGFYYWIGLTDKNSTGGFYWTDGSTYKYSNWIGSPQFASQCVRSNVIGYQGGSWSKGDCSEAYNYVCKVGRGQDRCYNPLGIQSFAVPNKAMTSNSVLGPSTPALAGRLYMKAGNSLDGAWCAGNNTKTPYLQIDFGKMQKLTYMGHQGKSNSDAMVTSYYIKYSQDGIVWDTYGYIPPAQYYKFKIYIGWRTNYEKVMNLPLPAPFIARYVRVYPLEWNIAPCMRIDFYGCQEEVDNQRCGLGWREDKKTKNCYKFHNQITTWDSAQELCSIQGANLATIATPDEREFLSEQLGEFKSLVSEFWIGLNDLDYEGVFKWVDGTPYQLSNWYYGNPKVRNEKSNCVVVRTTDSAWVNTECTVFRKFICKRNYISPYTPKESYNGYVYSKTDYFWPLDSATDFEGSLPLTLNGNVDRVPFPIDYDVGVSRYALNVSGSSGFFKIDVANDVCIHHPDADSCPHGITVSFVFKMSKKSSSKRQVIIDTTEKNKPLGYKVYTEFGSIYVNLRGHQKSYSGSTVYNAHIFNHMTFTWSSLKGLSLYMNGKSRVFDLLGSYAKDYPKVDYGKSLLIGISGDSQDPAELMIRSLGIFKQVLDAKSIEAIYLGEFGTCKSHQFAHGSYCYEYNSTEVSWSNALSTCRDNGGDLISIHSPVEQAFFNLKIAQYNYQRTNWIGLNAKSKNSFFKWADSSRLEYSYWAPLEPNNNNGRREDCVETFANGGWNDALCYLRNPFVCKYSRALHIMGSENTDDKEYKVFFSPYQTLTFGCPLGRSIEILTASYGSVKDGCVKDVKDKVSNACVKEHCVRVQASDFFFNKINPCKDKNRFALKRLKVTYKCNLATPEFDSTGCSNGKDSENSYRVFDKSNICYKLYRKPKTFKEAQKVCKDDNGDLVRINSRETQVYLTSLLHTMYQKTDIWIGMMYNSTTQNYEWLDGSHVYYTNWVNRQPDPRNGDYVKVGLEEGAKNFLFWKNGEANETLPFFCQRVKVGKTTQAPPTTQPRTGTCPKGWFTYNKNCYYVNTNRLSFPDAQAECQKYGKSSHLASVLSYEENRAVFYDVVNATVDFAWFGLTNEAIVTGFRWVDDQPVSFVNWYTNEPHKINRHLCVGMGSGGKWIDLACYLKYPSICKLPLGEVIPTTTPLPTIPPTQASGLCEPDWIHYNGSCYNFANRTSYADFHNARVTCNKMGAHVATIHYQKENDFISAQLKRMYIPNAYIGLTDFSIEGQWQWEDESVVSYINFGEGEPKNWHGMEDCVVVKSIGEWNDIPCNLKRSFVCKKNNGTVVKTVNTTAAPDSGYCPSGWKLYGNKCYYFRYGENNRLKFNDARQYCQQWKDDQGDLVAIHSNYENSFIMSQLYDVNEPMYIGLTDSFSERTFLWVDQSSVVYTNWYARQPSFVGNEDCVEMMPYFKTHGRWNDIGCSAERGFICQRTPSKTPLPTPEPVKDSKPCPAGYRKFMKACYRVVHTPMTYDDAVKDCRTSVGGEMGDLVSLHNQFEQSFVFSQFAKFDFHSWIGLKKIKGEKEFKWSDETPYDYRYWLSLRYDNTVYNDDKCTTQEFSSKVDGKWKVTDCTQKHPYMCKIERDFDQPHLTFIGNCTDGWTKFYDKCYKLQNYFSNWPAAREKCKGFGGNLVTITNSDIQKQMEYLARDAYRSVWIGLNDRAKEYVFEWSSGIPLLPDSYQNWGPNEPNDNSGTENCVHMTTESSGGKWNDLSCSQRMPYICEHPLECNSALGMEDGSIPDTNINATSYVGTYFPKYARLNAKSDNNRNTAWCTNITTGAESLTINLGEVMQITRISTQGLLDSSLGFSRGGYVVSYMLEYSNDGTTWMTYISEDAYDQKPIALPGNIDASKIDGTTINLKAAYLRFIPKLYKNIICMRVELYGCKSVCSRALGMTNFAISDKQLSVSSSQAGSEKAQLRPNIDGSWCAKDDDYSPFVRIDLPRLTKITRVTAISSSKVQYKIAYSDDGELFTRFQTLTNEERVFSTEPSTHDLETAISAKHVKFDLLKKDQGKLCLKVELYGCLKDCDAVLGMETKIIPDRLITASSAKPSNPARNARLSVGVYGDNSWCSSETDNAQYLQLDFVQEAHLTEIATQGFNGDSAKYVSKYNVQFSDDGDFWHQYSEELPGNSNGYSIQRNKLKEPIIARYIRINPTEWKNGICMRVEFYGCPMKPFTAPKILTQKTYNGAIRILSEDFNENLLNANSIEYIELANKVETDITSLYLLEESFKDGFNSVTVNKFREGSVITEFTIKTHTSDASLDAAEPLRKAVQTGRVGTFDVDPNFFEIVTASTDKSTTTNDDSGGLSNGGKIALIVFFVILICIVLAGGVVYYLRSRRNGFRLQFQHRAFENPTHVDDLQNDDMKVEFMNDDY